MKKLNALIIGAGKIGAFFDAPGDFNTLTHANAYTKNPHFRLVGFVDADKSIAAKAARRWGTQAYASLAEAVAAQPIDVVSLCTPEFSRYETLMQIKKHHIRGGIIEKPLTDSTKTGARLATDAYFIDHPFLVNYMRRHVKDFVQLAKKIRRGRYGQLVQGTIHYGKGLMHNGSHLLDLLLFFGIEVQVSQVTKSYNDFYENDKSYSAVLSTTGGGQIYMGVVPASLYRVFEMDLIFEKGRVSIRQDGFYIEEYVVGKDDVFPGYKVLHSHSAYKTELTQYMYQVVDDLYQAMTTKKTFGASVQDAFLVQKLCDTISSKIAK